MKSSPDFEQQEMVKLLQHEGIEEDDASRIVEILVRYPEAYHKTMVGKELGLAIETDTVKMPEALTMAARRDGHRETENSAPVG